MKMLNAENISRTFPCPLPAPDEDVGLALVLVNVVEDTDEGKVVLDPPFS